MLLREAGLLILTQRTLRWGRLVPLRTPSGLWAKPSLPSFYKNVAAEGVFGPAGRTALAMGSCPEGRGIAETGRTGKRPQQQNRNQASGTRVYPPPQGWVIPALGF